MTTLPPHIANAETPRTDAAFFTTAPINRYVAIAKLHACQLERENLYLREVVEKMAEFADAIANMPVFDQDDAHRLRNLGRKSLSAYEQLKKDLK